MTAPRTSPTPPMMTMISAFIVKSTPMEASSVRKVDRMVPPAAMTAPPSAKASAFIFGTSMATRPALRGSTATARRAMPVRVAFRPA